jgi:hypothetical protein
MADEDGLVFRADGFDVLRGEVDFSGDLLIRETVAEAQAQDLPVSGMMDILVDDRQHIAVFVFWHSNLQIKMPPLSRRMSGGSLFGGSFFV